jgi:hypothetical protein
VKRRGNELLRLLLFLATIGIINDRQHSQTRLSNNLNFGIRPAGSFQRVQGTLQGQQWFVLPEGFTDAVFDRFVDCVLVHADQFTTSATKTPAAQAPGIVLKLHGPEFACPTDVARYIPPLDVPMEDLSPESFEQLQKTIQRKLRRVRRFARRTKALIENTLHRPEIDQADPFGRIVKKPR